ncbi:MAG: hypothetical protein OK457_00555 [Thaumarchaeota archaeon]|nr:hypothetical protein [Nitrososphaerota archaeon]
MRPKSHKLVAITMVRTASAAASCARLSHEPLALVRYGYFYCRLESPGLVLNTASLD